MGEIRSVFLFFIIPICPLVVSFPSSLMQCVNEPRKGRVKLTRMGAVKAVTLGVKDNSYRKSAQIWCLCWKTKLGSESVEVKVEREISKVKAK